MRQIGRLDSQTDAQRFADFLHAQGIESRVDQTAGGWDLWVYDENQLPQSRRELEQFQQNPADEKYRQAQVTAKELRAKAAKKPRPPEPILMARRWDRPAVQQFPLTMALIAASVIVFVLYQFDAIPNSFQGSLFISANRDRDDPCFHRLCGLREIAHGQVWRLITPIFLHFGAMHLIFNVLAMHSLGRVIEFTRGTARLALLVVVSAAISNLGQYLYEGPNFGGMSGVAYALFGYAWMKSRFDRASGIFMPQSTVLLMIGWMLLCIAVKSMNVANGGHVVGFAVGLVAGYAPRVFKS